MQAEDFLLHCIGVKRAFERQILCLLQFDARMFLECMQVKGLISQFVSVTLPVLDILLGEASESGPQFFFEEKSSSFWLANEYPP
jgi:hypothetical protein